MTDPRYESLVDRTIREAQERGFFDNLPGAGKPLPVLAEPDDEQWWVRRYLRREGLSTDVLLPPSIQLRKELDRLPDSLRELSSEQAVRDVVREVDLRVVEFLRAPSGPRVPIGRVDVEEAVRRWRAERGAPGPRSAPGSPAPPPPAPVEPVSWWRRLVRGRRPRP